MSSPKTASSAGKRFNVFNLRCVLRTSATVALGLTAIGCASAPTSDPKSPNAANAQVIEQVLDSAQSECTIRTPPDPKAEPNATPSVFIEAFLIEIPAGAHWQPGAGSLADVVKLPGVKLIASPHVIARLNETATMDVGTRIMPPGAILDTGIHFKGLTVTPHFGAPGEVIVELDAALDTLEPEQAAARSAPVERHVRNTFAAHERKPSILHTPLAGYSNASLLLLVKPYVVTGEADLRDIFTCKMQERQRVLTRRASAQSDS